MRMLIRTFAKGGYGKMEILRIESDRNEARHDCSLACIGYFDGIHKGHQKLLQKVKALSQEAIPSVICFDSDPWIVMHKIEEARYITPLKARLELLEKMGMERCFLLHFNEAMMCLSPEAFIDQVLRPLHLQGIVCGEDFHFGYRGQGDTDTLRTSGIGTYVEATFQRNHVKVSSSLIEQSILNGNMREAYEDLGRFYSISGHVIHGRSVGAKRLGFPTANVLLDENYLLPKIGVYSGAVRYQGHLYKAMINVGHNPTFNYQDSISIEAHILDFHESIYGQTIQVYFYDYLRDEQKFNNEHELNQQLLHDVEYVRHAR